MCVFVLLSLSLSLSVPSEESPEKHTKLFEKKREVFREEWKILFHPSHCHLSSILSIFGFCDAGKMVFDVSEMLVPFDIADLVMRTQGKSEWWCWPVKWLHDIFRLLRHFSLHGMYVHPLAFAKYWEFGVSTLTGTLKVGVLQLISLFISVLLIPP